MSQMLAAAKAYAVVSARMCVNENGIIEKELVTHHVTHSEADADRVCSAYVPPDAHYGPAWVNRDYQI